MNQYWGSLLVTIAILFGAFLVLRELFCWYWKVNRIVDLLEENNRLLRGSSETKSGGAPEGSPAHRYAAGEITRDEYLRSSK